MPKIIFLRFFELIVKGGIRRRGWFVEEALVVGSG
jgi:hypothetical protein